MDDSLGALWAHASNPVGSALLQKVTSPARYSRRVIKWPYTTYHGQGSLKAIGQVTPFTDRSIMTVTIGISTL